MTETTNNIEEQIKDVLFKLAETPSESSNYFELGNLYYQQERFIDAKQNFKKAIELNPNVAIYYEKLGLTCEQVNGKTDEVNSNIKESAEAYERAIALES